MHRLIESLMPDAGHLYWKWVGGTFVLYIALMVTAAGVFISHESARKLGHEPAATVAMDRKHSGHEPGFDAGTANGAI